MDDKKKTSRRNFLTNMAMATVGTLSGASIVSAKPDGLRNTARKVDDLAISSLANRAPDGELLRAGLVGCGSRGTGAARQVEGCDNGRAQIITGTDGYADATGTIYNHQGEVIWEYPYPDENDTDSPWYVTNKYKQEHIELVKAIRTGEYLNDSEALIQSTRMAIMGRMAAYTGRDITWDEVLNSDLRLGPDTYELGPVDGISESPPVIGYTVPPTTRYS